MALAMLSSSEEVAGERTWRTGVRAVVWLREEEDVSTAARLAERLVAAATLGRGDVIVDMSDVQFVDLAIMRVLIRFHDLLWLQSRQVRLRAPSRFARRVIGLCGLDALTELAPTVATGGIGSCVMLRGPG